MSKEPSLTSTVASAQIDSYSQFIDFKLTLQGAECPQFLILNRFKAYGIEETNKI